MPRELLLPDTHTPVVGWALTLMYVKYGRGKRLARSRLGVGLPVPGRGWLGLRLGLGPVERRAAEQSMQGTGCRMYAGGEGVELNWSSK